MNKLCLMIAVTTAFACVFAPLSVAQGPTATAVVCGDVDLNSAVQSKDARMILRHAAKTEPLTEKAALLRADLDDNGEINAADARLCLRVAGRLAPRSQRAEMTERQILEKFTSVMNETRARARSYEKTEWWEISGEEFGAATDIIGSALRGFLPGREDADRTQTLDDASLIPPVNTAGVGCGLTDADAILRVSLTDHGDGTATIRIVLKDEVSPEPMDPQTGVSSSYTGGIFNVISGDDIRSKAADIGEFSLTELDVNYHDCVVVCTYDTETGIAKTIDYTAPARIDAEFSLTFNFRGGAEIVNRVVVEIK